MLGLSAVWWFSKFYLLITFAEKKYLVISLVHRVSTSLHECPFVHLLFSSGEKKFMQQNITMPQAVHLKKPQ